MDERDDDLSALIKAKATRHAAPSQLRARIDARIAEIGHASRIGRDVITNAFELATTNVLEISALRTSSG